MPDKHLHTGAEILGFGAAQTLTALEERGLSWQKAAIAAGLKPEKPDAEEFIPLEHSIALCEIAAKMADDEAFGVKVGSSAPIGIGAVFEYILLSAPSLGEALQNWQRFENLPCNAIHVSFEKESDWAYLSWQFPDSFGPRSQFADSLVAFAFSRIKHMTSGQSVSLKVQMSRQEPENSDEFRRILGDDVEFGCEKDRVGVPIDKLSLFPNTGEPNLFRIVEQSALRALRGSAYKEDQLYQIRNQVSIALKSGDASVEHVARKLGMSRRSLQRILEQAGTNYRNVVEDVRKHLAERYLKEADLRISDVAFLLGYSDISAFSRAAKGWFGMSPKAMKEKQKAFFDK